MQLTKKHKIEYQPVERTYDPRAEGAACDSCPLREDGIPVPAKPPVGETPLVILGEAPGPIEEHRYEYFAGPSGHELRVICRDHGIPWSKLHLNNCLQCRPKKELSIAQWKQATKCCWPRLEKELCRSGAKMILGLGKWSQWILLGKTDPIHDWAGCHYLFRGPAAVTGSSPKTAKGASKTTRKVSARSRSRTPADADKQELSGTLSVIQENALAAADTPGQTGKKRRGQKTSSGMEQPESQSQETSQSPADTQEFQPAPQTAKQRKTSSRRNQTSTTSTSTEPTSSGKSSGDSSKRGSPSSNGPSSTRSPDKRKKSLASMGVMISYHPAFALRGKKVFLNVLSEHLTRSWKLATGSLQPWKWPKMLVMDDAKAVRALRKMWRDIKSGKIDRLGVDIETNGVNPVTDRITKLGISSLDTAVSLSWPIRKDARHLVTSILGHQIAKAAHNGTHDLIGLEQAGYEVNGYEYDTIIQHAVWVPTMLHRLQFACCIEFHMPAWKKEYKVTADEKGKAYEPKSPEEWVEYGFYNAKDSYMTLLLSYALEKRLKNEVGNHEALYRGYLARSLISKEMRKTGLRIDRARVKKYLKQFMSEQHLAGEEIKKFAAAAGWKPKKGAKLNPASNDQMKDLFFKHLNAAPLRYSMKTGEASLDEKSLQSFSTHQNPAVAAGAQLQLRFRRWAKLVSIARRMYVGGSIKNKTKQKEAMRALRGQKDLIIHADGQCWGTKTGRWAYRDPNLTTIPKPKKKKNDAGEWVTIAPGLRDCVRSREGKKFVEVDSSQLELRIVAYVTGDQLLMDWYDKGIDVHTENAKHWFGTDNPSSSQRSFAKMMVYAMNYGGSAKTIWQNLVVDYQGLYLSDVERYIKIWYMNHPAIREWQKKIFAKAEYTSQVYIPLSGKVVNLYGDPPDPPKVYNPPIQGTAAAIIDGAIERVWPQLDRARGDNLLLQVHDALIGESVRPFHMANLFKTEMERPVEVGGRQVVFPADVQIGSSWGECDEISEEELKKGLKDEQEG